VVRILNLDSYRFVAKEGPEDADQPLRLPSPSISYIPELEHGYLRVAYTANTKRLNLPMMTGPRLPQPLVGTSMSSDAREGTPVEAPALLAEHHVHQQVRLNPIFLDSGPDPTIPFSLPPYPQYFILRLEDVRALHQIIAPSSTFNHIPPVFANPNIKAKGHALMSFAERLQ